jgi:hypothetical protein
MSESTLLSQMLLLLLLIPIDIFDGCLIASNGERTRMRKKNLMGKLS